MMFMNQLNQIPKTTFEADCIIRKNPDQVKRLVYNVIPKRIIDDFQEIYAYLLEHTQNRYDCKHKLSTYIAGVSNQLYKNKNRKRILLNINKPNSLSQSEKEVVYEILKHIKTLPEKHYLIIDGYFFKNMTLKELSVLTGYSASQVFNIKNCWIQQMKRKYSNDN